MALTKLLPSLACLALGAFTGSILFATPAGAEDATTKASGDKKQEKVAPAPVPVKPVPPAKPIAAPKSPAGTPTPAGGTPAVPSASGTPVASASPAASLGAGAEDPMEEDEMVDDEGEAGE